MTLKQVSTSVFDTIFLMRIPLLIPVWTVLLLGYITGSPSARIGDLFTSGSPLLWPALVGFSFIVAGIYVCNQIRDVESDRINHKLFILPQGLISIRAAWGVAAACSGIGMAIGLIYLPPQFTILFASGIILGIFYNLPPLSLKDRPIGGAFLNLLGHGVITWLVGYYAATGYAPLHWHDGLVPSLSAGFANAAVYLASTVADIKGDSQTGKNTWAVAWGARSTAIAAAVCGVLSLISAFVMPFNSWVMILPSAISVPIFLLFAISADSRFSFRAFRIPVAVLSIAVALFIPVYVPIVLVTVLAARIYYKWRFNFDYPSLKAQ